MDDTDSLSGVSGDVTEMPEYPLKADDGCNSNHGWKNCDLK